MTRRNNFSQCVGYLMNTLDTAFDAYNHTGMIYFNISPTQLEELIKLKTVLNEVFDLPGNILVNNFDNNK